MRTYYLLTIHPQFVEAYGSFGPTRAAADKSIAEVKAINLRDFAVDRHGSVDDRPYGGGQGAVLRIEPIVKAIRSLAIRPTVILPSPQGTRWDYQLAKKFSACPNLLFICGRFRGLDQRVIDHHVDHCYSLGNFVISGGELAALAMVDSILRLIPAVVGNYASVIGDSPDNWQRSVPLYTRPREFEGQSVPEVLLSGDQQKITEWQQQFNKTIPEPQLATKAKPSG